MITNKLSYWNKAVNDLKQKDKILAKIINSHNKEYLIVRETYFITLIRAIIGQQISVKAAQSIWVKFRKQYRTINKTTMLVDKGDQLQGPRRRRKMQKRKRNENENNKNKKKRKG